MKYSEIVNISSNFSEVYKVDDEKNNEWKRYIITRDFTNSTGKIINAYTSTNQRRSIWIQGTYGTGKSHTLAVFKHVLSDDYTKIKDFIDRIEDPQVKNDVINFRKNHIVFPVVLNGIYGISDTLSLSQQIQNQVKKALSLAGIELEIKTDLEQMKFLLKNDLKPIVKGLIEKDLNGLCHDEEELFERLDSNDFDVFKKIEKKFKDTGIILTTSNDINSWLSDVTKELQEKTNYDYLTLFWDEFTSILELTESRALLGAINNIAQLVEKNIYLFLVTHKFYNTIDGYKNLVKDDQKKIEDRFFVLPFSIDPLTNYYILSNAIIKIDNEKFSDLVDKRVIGNISIMDSIQNIVGNKTNHVLLVKQLINLYPFHPYVSYSSTMLARIVGSAQRSVFQFLNDNDTGFLKFIEEDINNEKFLTIEWMWDFFYSKFSENPKYFEVINTFLKYESAINDLDKLNSNKIYIRIFKCVLLLNILQNSLNANDEFLSRNLLRPTLENIKLAFTAVFEENEIKTILDMYHENGMLTRNPMGDYTVTISSISNEKVNQEKNNLYKGHSTIPDIIKNYTAEKLVFKRDLCAEILRESSIEFLPFSFNETSFGNKIDELSKELKTTSNTQIIIFLSRGFNNDLLQDELSEEELRLILLSYSKNKNSNYIFLICKDYSFNERRYDNWINEKARENIAKRTGDDSSQYSKNANSWITEYFQELKKARYSVVFKGNCVEKVFNDLSSFIANDIIKKILFKNGLENLSSLHTTVWKKRSSTNSKVIEKMVQPTFNEVLGSKSSKLSSNLYPLLYADGNIKGNKYFDESMKFICLDSSNPLYMLIKKIDEVFNNCKTETSIDLVDKFSFLFENPWGYYNCDCCNAALALGFRKYINKIRLVGAQNKLVNEASMKNLIVSLFDAIIENKTSEALKIRFSTESEIKLANNLAMIFGIDIDDDSTLASIRWVVRDRFATINHAPLWVLKYIRPENKLDKLIDKLFQFTLTIDINFTEEETKELSLLVDSHQIDLQNIITTVKDEDCFITFLTKIINERKEDLVTLNDLNQHINNKLKSEINFKEEKEVLELIDDFYNGLHTEKTETDDEKKPGDLVDVQPGGGTIIPGSQVQIKKNVAIELLQTSDFDNKAKELLEQIINNCPQCLEYVIKYFEK